MQAKHSKLISKLIIITFLILFIFQVNSIGTPEERKAAKARVWAVYGEGPLAQSP